MQKLFMYTVSIILIALQTACKHETTHDELVSHIDSTINPCDDFFMFANGTWFKEHPIPANKADNGLWEMVQDTINAQIKQICTLSASLTNNVKGSNKQKIGDFYFSGMDSVNLNKRGIDDLKPELLKIDSITDLNGLMKVSAHINIISESPMFSVGIEQDDKISNKYAVYIFQDGLSMPDRNYYLDNDARAVATRKKFVEHLKTMFEIIGYNQTKAVEAAKTTMEIETTLAKESSKREDTRDPSKYYNKMSFQKMTTLAPVIDWKVYLDIIGLHNVDSVIVCEPEYLRALNENIKHFSLEQWKDYLKYKLMKGLASYLDDKTYMTIFSFYSTELRGIKEPKPRWERVVTKTNAGLGELIGQVYVKEYLPQKTKEKLLEIGNAIKTEYAERIKALDWMSSTTKEKALQKLAAITMKVGYPDTWKDLTTLEVTRSSYVKNVMNANEWECKYNIKKYGNPVDRSEWQMQPQTYNAYYNPLNNEICIPGCNIIIPGYEHVLADDALLYAIIGSTFGHEITHGFDDQGSKYDKNGNLHNWWTATDSIKFYKKTKMIVRQFNAYVAVDSLHINGELTQGENIADLAGIAMALEAFKKTNQCKNNITVANVNPIKRFFLGYAFGWMVNQRPESVANQVRSNEHSPVKFRVNAPLSNIAEFYSAFALKPTDKMWRNDSLRVKIW